MASPIIYIPHGGGPMPLLNEPNHLGLINFLTELPAKLGEPKAVLVISAHWEEDITTISSRAQPELIYDYYGFPEESYQIQYKAAGEPELADKIMKMLKWQDISVKLDPKRGLDHGTFVPLKLIYPNADIPVVQLSLTNDLDPQKQINVGKAIGKLVEEEVLIIGSGLSFHNLKVLMSCDPIVYDKSERFDSWLNNIVTNQALTWHQKEQSLVNWLDAPEARYAHPREEHLLPLHICFGAAWSTEMEAKNIFNEKFLGTQVSAFLWQ